MNVKSIIENIAALHVISSVLILFLNKNDNYISLIINIGLVLNGLIIVYAYNYKIYIFNYIIFMILQVLTIRIEYIISSLFHLLGLVLNIMSIKLIISYKNL